ncbi:NAC domain-containing protein 83 [Brachypodium distachyon]|uniref:NAC domain-containing protein 83 n=1 Tax=Brachypodium distachyon TaxID=15368 RepID=UPI000D0D62F5|nr:NAC domain-containing protein 83 [Brachypodium distachyon]|eukprot:XP_024310365.1 NAC domain-containing protein 83 [Brachypodium distachyon]
MADGSVLMLPSGFKFRPSDKDLILEYLYRRSIDEPLPWAVIVEADIMGSSPWDLLPEGAKEKYFLTRRDLKYMDGSRINRITQEGYWKARRTESPIYVHNILVGMRRSLLFYVGTPKGMRTIWAMREYRLAGAGLSPCMVMRPTGSETFGRTCQIDATATAKRLVLCVQRNDVLSSSLCNTVSHDGFAPKMVYPDESWVICRMYKKRTRASPIITLPAASSCPGVRARFTNFMEANRESSLASSSIHSPSLDKEEEGVGSGENKPGSNN